MGSYIYPKRANRLRNHLYERIEDTITGFLSDPDPGEVRDATSVLVDLLFDEEFVTEDNALNLIGEVA